MEIIKLNQEKQIPLDKDIIDKLKKYKALMVLNNMDNYKIDIGIITQLVKYGSLSKMNCILLSEEEIDDYWFNINK